MHLGREAHMRFVPRLSEPPIRLLLCRMLALSPLVIRYWRLRWAHVGVNCLASLAELCMKLAHYPMTPIASLCDIGFVPKTLYEMIKDSCCVL